MFLVADQHETAAWAQVDSRSRALAWVWIACERAELDRKQAMKIYKACDGEYNDAKANVVREFAGLLKSDFDEDGGRKTRNVPEGWNAALVCALLGRNDTAARMRATKVPDEFFRVMLRVRRAFSLVAGGPYVYARLAKALACPGQLTDSVWRIARTDEYKVVIVGRLVIGPYRAHQLNVASDLMGKKYTDRSGDLITWVANRVMPFSFDEAKEHA